MKKLSIKKLKDAQKAFAKKFMNGMTTYCYFIYFHIEPKKFIINLCGK